MSEQESLPNTDDIQTDGPSEQELLDAVMRNSPLMDEVIPPLPEEETSEEDPVETEEEVEDPDSEEAVSEEVEEEVEEVEEEEPGEDDTSTQDPEIYTTDDLDLDAQVSVKIDGEDVSVSFGDLIKGYTTEQSLSKKGRELGEARKELEAERENKLAELEQTVAASHQVILSAEKNFSKQYHDLVAQIDKARKDGDTYELGELKDKKEQVQERYWGARKQREALMEQISAQREKFQQEQLQQQLTSFQETIPDLIPDFNDELAGQIRQFALDEGIAEGLLDSVVDPNIVKFIDDYRRLKQGVKKGTAKRKAVPAKKALPTKKAASPTKKKQNAEAQRKAKAFKEGSSQDDQMAFLRDYASKSLNNI